MKVRDEAFRIVWDDGHVSTYPIRYLRQICACAYCKDERTGKPLLDKESVPADLKGEEAALVGRYALRFGFSDKHASGIYPFTLLRESCPCAECAGGR